MIPGLGRTGFGRDEIYPDIYHYISPERTATRALLKLDGFHLLTRFAQGGHGCLGLLLLRRDLRVQQRLALLVTVKMGKHHGKINGDLNVIYRNLISVEQENDGEIEKEMIHITFDIC